MTSDIQWWMLGLSAFATWVFFHCLIRKGRQEQYRAMKDDGLTDQDIENIVGRESFLKLIKA